MKATAFLRFLIFILITVPTIYLGVSYAKGEDGIQNVKNLVHDFPSEEIYQKIISVTSSTQIVQNPDSTFQVNKKQDCVAEVERMTKEIQNLKMKVKELEAKR